MGTRALYKILLGQEASTDPGTAVPATTYWRGIGAITDLTEQQFPAENVGIISGVDRSYFPFKLAQIDLDPVEATFEQLDYLLLMGVDGSVAGVQDGAGSDYIRTYNGPTTVLKSPLTYTLEVGDDAGMEEVEYCFATEIVLSGAGREGIMMSATLNGRQITPTTFTPSTDLTFPTVEDMIFGKSKLYVDATTDAFGTTLKSQTFMGFEWKYTTGFVPVFTGEGQLYFSFTKLVVPELVCTVTFEHDATSIAEKAFWRAGTSRKMRIDVTGSTVTTPGTTYSTKKLLLDMAGKWDSFEKIDEQDGNDIVSGVFRSRYNPTVGSFFSVTTVNELATLL